MKRMDPQDRLEISIYPVIVNAVEMAYRNTWNNSACHHMLSSSDLWDGKCPVNNRSNAIFERLLYGSKRCGQ